MHQELCRDATPELNIFVYGTLKPGEANYESYCKTWVVAEQEAMIRGQLYSLPFGYPALTVGQSSVYGFLLSFTDSHILNILDDLEDYDPERSPEQNHYFRAKTDVFSLSQQSLGSAWVYYMLEPKVQKAGGILLRNGKWSGEC